MNRSEDNRKEKKGGFAIRGKLIDYAVYPDGRRELIQEVDNIVVDVGLTVVAGAIGDLANGIDNLQVGEGLEDWDLVLPDPDSGTTELVNPLISKAVTINYWNEALGQISITPTNVLDLRVTFLTGEGNGDLREMALRGGATADTLYNYIIHAKVVKDSSYNLERILRIHVERIP